MEVVEAVRAVLTVHSRGSWTRGYEATMVMRVFHS